MVGAGRLRVDPDLFDRVFQPLVDENVVDADRNTFINARCAVFGMSATRQPAINQSSITTGIRRAGYTPGANGPIALRLRSHVEVAHEDQLLWLGSWTPIQGPWLGEVHTRPGTTVENNCIGNLSEACNLRFQFCVRRVRQMHRNDPAGTIGNIDNGFKRGALKTERVAEVQFWQEMVP